MRYAPPVRRPLPSLRCCSFFFGALALLGCKDPPEIQRVPPPEIHRDKAEALTTEAHREALELALPKVRSLLMAADPLAAWQLGLAPAASPPLGRADRRALERRLAPVNEALGEIDESRLPGADVVVLRLLRFALARINDDLRRRSPAAEDPMVALHRLAANLDELSYRLLIDDCDEHCEALPGALAEDVDELAPRLIAASRVGVEHAAGRARELASRSRELAGNALAAERAPLRANLDTLASALDRHASWLDELATKLDAAPARNWPEPHEERKPEQPVARLPALIGADSLIRRLSVEQRIDLVPPRAFAEIERMVRRWQTLRETLIEQDVPEPKPTVVDVARCEAALTRVRDGLAQIDDVEPPALDCGRYVAWLGGATRDDGALILDLIDYGMIEPQRRKLRAAELPEVALVTGEWSTLVHTHLRRVMLLARLGEPAATAQALTEGRLALCWAEAALWVHAQLGPPEDVALSVGGPCVELGDAAAITAAVTGDPRGSLRGFGLSLIGDEPARMVGFDRFFWAPLGTMKLLATPKGMHPDTFTLPDDPAPPETPPPEVKIEPL